ncbi:DUF998 domain-containing protein [Phytohabitans sp. LJ34]|uniref:DUF998 domain-containing protein n=1 Tax=Phytohabitans sp. LJ34 TaxID=3452217 RepID=UPI003F886A7A
MDVRGRGARQGRLVAAVAAPLLLMAGTLLAEALQPPGFDPLDATLSDMASLDAAHREVMTGVIIGMGAWFAVTGWWLAVVGKAGRIMLGAGGAACLGIIAYPVSEDAVPLQHFVFATLAFSALSLWPVAGMRRSVDAPWPVRPAAAITVSAVLCVLSAWFTVTVTREAGMGLPEHILAVIQVTWPSVVAFASRDRPRAAAAPSPGRREYAEQAR